LPNRRHFTHREELRQVGLAIDVAHVNDDGSIDWSFDTAKLQPYCSKYGITWGGSWVHKDKPHFEINFRFNENCHDLKSLHDAGKVDADGYVTF